MNVCVCVRQRKREFQSTLYVCTYKASPCPWIAVCPSLSLLHSQIERERKPSINTALGILYDGSISLPTSLCISASCHSLTHILHHTQTQKMQRVLHGIVHYFEGHKKTLWLQENQCLFAKLSVFVLPWNLSSAWDQSGLWIEWLVLSHYRKVRDDDLVHEN